MTASPVVRDCPSPNHGPRRGGAVADMVVLHHTAMDSTKAALARLCDPGPEVSAHYLIAEDGAIFRLVPEHRRAWHAGRSSWAGVKDVNSSSIGIELANSGVEPHPAPQMRALERLLGEVLARHTIPPKRVVGHACIAPGRKHDPGRRFDWRRLALSGLSVWQPPPDRLGWPPDPVRFAAAARAFGYRAPDTPEWGAASGGALDDVWAAFALRFRPHEAGLPPDASGLAQLEALASRWPA